ncbi:MAG: hypothetical protein JWR38_230 [Mucilaginibacter sp.]|nr:hypothetical protein [Mucilaginibacter sp.]
MTNPVNTDNGWGDRIYKLKMKKIAAFLVKISLNDYILKKILDKKDKLPTIV